MSKQLLLGDEAIAQAALDAGLSGVYAYPGTPSTEITEYIQMAPITAEKNIHNRWCSNEKTAMEAALGMSFAGKRSLVCMKHVGMNVAADCFINSAITGVKGGLIAVSYTHLDGFSRFIFSLITESKSPSPGPPTMYTSPPSPMTPTSRVSIQASDMVIKQ